MAEKTIFLTGADGFIGSHLSELLIRKGYKVRALCQYNSSGSKGWLDYLPPEIGDEIEKVSGDIRDGDHITDLVKGCNAVLHLAALIAIPYSYSSPRSYLETNVIGTLNVLQAARAHSIEKVIHTSTSEVYGSAKFVPITEEHPLIGQSPYAASKIAADQLAYSFFSSYDVPVTILRPFNTYGPRQSTRAVIPTIITQILNGARYIKLGSLHPTRDFNYIDDTVSGFAAAVEAVGTDGEVINIGSNFEISISEVVMVIASCCNSEIKIVTEERRTRPEKSEVERLFSSNAKALKILNWKPAYSGKLGFKDGIEKTVEWFSDPANLAMYRDAGYMI